MNIHTEELERPPTFRTRLATLIDGGVVIVLLLALGVFMFGGFREYFGSVRLSVRSADRLVLIAALLAGLRHMLVRTPTMFTAWRGAVVRARASHAMRAALPVFIASRAAVLLAGYLGVVTIGSAPGTERFRVTDDPLGNLLARWDAAWYVSIAQQGYQWNGNPKVEQNVVFFPAFPTAMRILGPFLGRNWLLAGVVLALGAFLLALMYLYRLAAQLMEAHRARDAVWLVAAYPFAVYYSAPYTEAFYLLGSAATFFHLTRGEWWKAAGWGFFLALCRPNGFFIALPAAIFVGRHVLVERRISVAAIAACVAPGLGVLAYCAYLYARFGEPLAWMQGQAAWGRVFVGIGPGLYALFFDRFEVISNAGWAYYITLNPYDFIYSCAAVFVLASLWPCARRFGAAYALFVAVNIVPPLLMGGMMSIGRMTAVLFPAFFWIASTGSERTRSAVILAFSILQGLVAVLFFTWRPVF